MAKDPKPTTEWMPLLDALDYADSALGFDAWGLIKDWTRHNMLPMWGQADGVPHDILPHWFSFLAQWGSDADDRPRRPTVRLDDRTKLLTAPQRLTSPEDILYFDVPREKLHLKVPSRVSEVIVEMNALRRLIKEWKLAAIKAGKERAAEIPRRSVGRPGTLETSIEIFKARRSRGVPPQKKKIDEARAIVGEWTSGDPPLPKTVSGHITETWRTARKSGDKL